MGLGAHPTPRTTAANGRSPGADFWGCGDAGPQRSGLCEIKPREGGWPTGILESSSLSPTFRVPDFPDFPAILSTRIVDPCALISTP